VCAVPALVAAPALGLAGFGANGIVGGSSTPFISIIHQFSASLLIVLLGSLAAGAQSGIGSDVAPSLFATLQSAGAGGYGLSAVYGAVQGAAAVGAGGSLAASFRGKKKNDKEKKGDKYDEESEADEEDEGDEKKPAENKSGEAGGESKDDNKPRL